jgi:hypothetical protein
LQWQFFPGQIKAGSVQLVLGLMLASHVLKGMEMGLIPVECLIRWADKKIVAAEVPEAWLIDLATTRADSYDVISVMRQHGASTEVDDETFLALIAYAFFNSRLELEQVRRALFCRFCTIDWKEMTPLRQEIYVFDDEMDWDANRARRTCETILQPFRDVGERLVSEYIV